MQPHGPLQPHGTLRSQGLIIKRGRQVLKSLNCNFSSSPNKPPPLFFCKSPPAVPASHRHSFFSQVITITGHHPTSPAPAVALSLSYHSASAAPSSAAIDVYSTTSVQHAAAVVPSQFWQLISIPALPSPTFQHFIIHNGSSPQEETCSIIRNGNFEFSRSTIRNTPRALWEFFPT